MAARSLPAHIEGGMERITADAAAGLARRGWRIDLVTTRLDGDAGLPPGVRVHALDAPAGRHSARFRRALVRWSEERPERPDLIFSVSFTGAPLLRRWPEVPSVCQIHGSAWREAWSKLRRLDPRGLYRLGLHAGPERECLREADRIIATGPEVRRGLASRAYRFVDGNRIVTIPNGIDVGEILRASATDRGAIRAALGVPEGDRLVLSACRLIRSKGVWRLLNGYEAMEERSRTTLLFTSAGREMEAMRDFCGRRGLRKVRFLGRIDREAVARAIHAADLLVQISVAPEGLPLVVLESLCAGTPVLLSRRVRLPSYAGEEGIITVDPASTGEVAAALQRGVHLGAPREEGARAARREFSLETMLDRYEGVMEEAIREKAR